MRIKGFKINIKTLHSLYLLSSLITLFTLAISGICIFCILFSMPLTTIAAPVPDTGQTGDYTETFGEDSDYTINTPSYTKLDSVGKPLPLNATSWVMVYDNYTGLTWEVKTDDGTVHDKDNAYDWYYAEDEFIWTLRAANFGGFDDWRMPLIQEFSMIVNSGRHNPAINTDYFPNTQSSRYCSFSTGSGYPGSSDNAWRIDFIYGSVYGFVDKWISDNVRAVRGRVAFNDFIDNGDNTVSDNLTGLMWQQATAGPMRWEAALDYCESLNLAGYEDWRLPNRNELQSIVEYGTSYPAIDTYAFPDIEWNYWSSTTFVDDPGSAWLVDFVEGSIGNSDKSLNHHVRAVRGGQARLFGDLVISVTDAGSGFAVMDANVVISDPNLIVDQIYGLSGPSGEASLTCIPFGGYDLTITALGYIPLEVPLTVFYAGSMKLEYVLTPSCTVYFKDWDQDGYGRDDDYLCLGGPDTLNHYTAIVAGDCMDNDKTLYPGAVETCDNKDNDCNPGTVDGSGETWLGQACDGEDTDLCEEGFYACTGGTQVCSDVTGDTVEVCDGQDNDCDGQIAVNESDADNDNYMVCEGDCDDTNPAVHPGAKEVKDDGIDQDCDGKDLKSTPAFNYPYLGGIYRGLYGSPIYSVYGGVYGSGIYIGIFGGQFGAVYGGTFGGQYSGIYGITSSVGSLTSGLYAGAFGSALYGGSFTGGIYGGAFGASIYGGQFGSSIYGVGGAGIYGSVYATGIYGGDYAGGIYGGTFGSDIYGVFFSGLLRSVYGTPIHTPIHTRSKPRDS